MASSLFFPGHTPTALHANIGGFSSTYFDLLLESDGRLRYHQGPTYFPMPHDNVPRWLPKPSEWSMFLSLLETAGVAHWKPDYCDPRVLDGTQWVWRIEIAGQVFKSSGSNAYPPEIQFRTWLQALSVLAQGRAFGR